jgi:hypothetical protein
MYFVQCIVVPVSDFEDVYCHSPPARSDIMPTTEDGPILRTDAEGGGGNGFGGRVGRMFTGGDGGGGGGGGRGGGCLCQKSELGTADTGSLRKGSIALNFVAEGVGSSAHSSLMVGSTCLVVIHQGECKRH